MKRNEKLDRLLQHWYAGETSDREADALRRALLSGDTDAKRSSSADAQGQPDHDHSIDAMLFAGFRALAAERMPEITHSVTGMPAATPAIDPFATAGTPETAHSTVGMPASARPAHRTARRPLRRIVGRAIAVAAVIAFGFVLGLQFREPYCYIDGKPVYDRETALAATEYLDGLAALQLPEQLLEQLLKN